MSANSLSLSFTPLPYLAGMLLEFLLVLVLFSRLPFEFVVQFSSSRVHLPRSFAVLIQFLWIWLLLSVRFFSLFLNLFEEFVDVIFPSFLGLPIDLLVLYFELGSGFHSAAFINHLSSMMWRFSSNGNDDDHTFSQLSMHKAQKDDDDDTQRSPSTDFDGLSSQ